MGVEGNLGEAYRGGGWKQRVQGEEEGEKVRRETKDGRVVTSAVRANEWRWYEGLEEVEWERFHVKMFDLGNNIWVFHACVTCATSPHFFLLHSCVAVIGESSYAAAMRKP